MEDGRAWKWEARLHVGGGGNVTLRLGSGALATARQLEGVWTKITFKYLEGILLLSTQEGSCPIS